ncbi:beta-galactosidase [Haliangium sp.]|uniref:beta-galactosidase n=1 Tax=Haliangium sp. TaxID=2663208 RepID=UPI003D1161DA
MDAHRRSLFTERGIAVRRSGADGGGRVELDLFAGAVHYWRLDRADWRACLDGLRALGLSMVQVAVPWSVHERRAGGWDWSGDRDLAGFLDLVGDMDMHALVRPGPIVGAELPGAGLPSRLLARTGLHALSARGTAAWIPSAPRMFPLLSWAAPEVQAEVEAWFAAVGEVVAPRLAPNGPVIAVEVGHAAQLGARLGPFELDYHPAAMSWWHELAGPDQPPPRAWDRDDVAQCVRWVRFREFYLARTLAWMGAALSRAGLRSMARFHALPWAEPGHFDLPGVTATLAAEDPVVEGAAANPLAAATSSPGAAMVSMECSHRLPEPTAARRAGLYLAGSAAPLAVAGVVVGGPALGVPAVAAAAPQAVLGLLAAGVRGLHLRMAVDRTGWAGAPLSEVGEAQPAATWLGRLLAALTELEWTRLEREVPVGVVVSRADRRVALASSAAGPLASILEQLLPPGAVRAAELAQAPDAAGRQRWLDLVEDALVLAQVPYVLVDEAAPAARLASFRALVVPTGERVDRALWRRLGDLAERGVVVVLGPGRPSRDERDQPLGDGEAAPAGAGFIRARSAEDIDGLADDLAAVAGDLSDLWITAEQTGVDCSLFSDRAGRPRVLFTGNRRQRPVTADVLVPAGTELVDVLSGQALRGEADGGEAIVDVPLGAGEIRMFRID